MSVRAADDQLLHAQVDSLLVQALDDFALVTKCAHAVVEGAEDKAFLADVLGPEAARVQA